MFTQSKWFFAEFMKIFSVESASFDQAVQCYAHNTDFSNFIIKKINDIISSRGYIAQNEYYRIDAMGYTTKWKDLGKIKSFNPHLWNLEIAVEHENNPKDWLDEVIKLAHICCPLRVVIGYAPMKNRDCGDKERLEYASRALRMLNCRDNLKNGEFMIILGNSGTKSPKDYFNYKAYVLNKETLSFEIIDNDL